MSDRKPVSAADWLAQPARPLAALGRSTQAARSEETSARNSTCERRLDSQHGATGAVAVRNQPARPGGQENPVIQDHPGIGPDLDAQLTACNLKKSYRKGPVVIPVLRGVDLSVRQGELLSIIGKSGSGKSTLLHLLATLDGPDEGEIYFEGQRIDNLGHVERDRLRNRDLGMIFQFYHLLPELTTLENVLAPLMIGHSVYGYFRRRRQIQNQAKDLLQLVGLSHRLRHKPRELSGGEMQRAAIARALVSNPQVLLADEPTGNLDYASGREILELLRRLNAEQNLTIVMVTHDLGIAQLADRSVELVQGRVGDPASPSLREP
ncbi:MAG: ABC transporter ATP-binding protein [Thermoguttaceae bacterium]